MISFIEHDKSSIFFQIIFTYKLFEIRMLDNWLKQRWLGLVVWVHILKVGNI